MFVYREAMSIVTKQVLDPTCNPWTLLIKSLVSLMYEDIIETYGCRKLLTYLATGLRMDPELLTIGLQ